MIVSDKNVQDALAYLADDPHQFALATKDLTDAENARKEAFATAFIAAQGGAEARKASAEIDPKYIEAKREESAAILNKERHRSRCKAAEMILEIWRTESANVRAAESMR
jgi:hypothetical protein